MSATANPYQTPAAELSPNFPGGMNPEAAAAMRQLYLRHEAGVRSVGILYFISCALFLALVPVGLLMLNENAAAGMGIGVLGLAFAGLFAWMGIEIRKLRPRVRVAVGITSAIGLFNPPVGTLINLYILYLVFGAKGKVVFSEAYSQVVQQTPQIQYQTPLVVKILALLLLALVVAALFAVGMQA